MSYTTPTLMIRNYAEEKRAKDRMIINYRKLNNNTIFDGYYIPNKVVIFNINSRSLLVLKNGLQNAYIDILK